MDFASRRGEHCTERLPSGHQAGPAWPTKASSPLEGRQPEKKKSKTSAPGTLAATSSLVRLIFDSEPSTGRCVKPWTKELSGTSSGFWESTGDARAPGKPPTCLPGARLSAGSRDSAVVELQRKQPCKTRRRLHPVLPLQCESGHLMTQDFKHWRNARVGLS